MDKFGIFNLLNALTNNSQSSANKEQSTKTDNPLDLSALVKSLFTPNKPPERSETTTPPAAQKTFLPLQSSMISTMNGHDEFVKRVMEKNKSKN